MHESSFVDGAWYVSSAMRGTTRAHFYQRTGVTDRDARSSCGMVVEVFLLDPSDHPDAEKQTKDNPRARCVNCWNVELGKARRT